MALKLSTIADGTLEVVARIDGAIADDLTEDEYMAYLETLDQSLLRLKDGEKPTLFVMRRVLPYALSQKVANKQLRLDEGNKLQPQLGYMTEEVRCALIGIKNPDNLADEDKIKFERGSDGGASEDLVARLAASGIAMNLYHARNNAMTKTKQDSKKN